MKVLIKKLLANILKAFSTEVEFTLTQSVSGDGWSRGIYNPLTKTVRIEATLYDAATFSHYTAAFRVPQQYRPKSKVIVPMVAALDTGVWCGYRGWEDTDGGIGQSLTSTSKGLIVQVEYRI